MNSKSFETESKRFLPDTISKVFYVAAKSLGAKYVRVAIVAIVETSCWAVRSSVSDP